MITPAAIEEFLMLHRTRVIVVTAVLLVILILILVIPAISGSSPEVEDSSRQTSPVLSLRDLWLPAEPLQSPGIIPPREPKTQWDKQETDLWFRAPDASDIEALQEINRRKILDLLEAVP